MAPPLQAFVYFLRQRIKSLAYTMPKSSSAAQACQRSKPLRPLPLSQLSTPRHSTQLRITHSFQSLLRQSSLSANKHTLHHPRIRTSRMLSAWNNAIPALLTGTTATACACILYYTQMNQPMHADGGLNPSDFAPFRLPVGTSFPHFSLFCVDQLQIVKDMAQLGPM